MGEKQYIGPLACIGEAMPPGRIVSADVQISLVNSRLFTLGETKPQSKEEKVEEAALKTYMKLMCKLTKRIDRGQ